MEAIHDPRHSSVSWVARLVEVLQPLSVRADRLAAMELFTGLRWSDLEFVADRFEDTEVERGTRMTVQGRPSSRLWLITQGEALVSANARPLRVAGYGDAIGLTSMLLGGGSPDTTIALARCARWRRARIDSVSSSSGRRFVSGWWPRCRSGAGAANRDSGP